MCVLLFDRRGERQRPDEVATRPMFAHHMMGNMFGNMMSDMRSMMNSMQPHINSMQSQMLQTVSHLKKIEGWYFFCKFSSYVCLLFWGYFKPGFVLDISVGLQMYTHSL